MFSFPIMQIVILGQRYVKFTCVYLLSKIHYISNYTTSAGHTHVHRVGEKKGKQREIFEKFNHPKKVAVYVSLPGQWCQNWTNFIRIWHHQTVSHNYCEIKLKSRDLCILQHGLLFTQHFPCLACRTVISGSTFFFKCGKYGYVFFHDNATPLKP